MRILREDENQLTFVVYPTKYFLLFMIFFILLFVYALFHPEVNNIDNLLKYFNITLSPSQSIIAGIVTTTAIIVYFLIILVVSYLIPIRVDIDKLTKKITYQYLAYSPIKAVGEATHKITKTILISDLQKLVYSDKIPEVPLTSSRSLPHALGKFSFILKDNSSINVYAGAFSQFPHKYAFKKIADYLKVPYENVFVEESPMVKFADLPVNKSHLIKILLIILMVIILILVLFVDSIFLIGFISQFQ